MREQLLIQQKTLTADGRGGNTATWSTLDSCPAERITLSSGERIEAQRLGSQVQYRFRIRADSRVTAKMRALWSPAWPDGATRQLIEITGVEPDDKDFGYVFLQCTQHDGQVP